MKSPSLESMLGRKILFLSPHADDVAYSVGGLVAQLAMRSDLHLITIFGRSGWALPEASRGKSADEISAEREREDRAYCARRWIKYELLPCPDSFTAGYDEVTELSSAATDDPRTGGVVNMVRSAVAYRMPQFVLAPCGLGGHVDHQIVRLAADGLENVDVLYYEDVPYSSELPLHELEQHLADQGLAPAMTADIDAVLERKCEDMWSYCSQTSLSTIAEMLLHARRVGIATGTARYAERLWHRVS